MAKSSPASVRIASSAAGMPPSRKRRRTQLGHRVRLGRPGRQLGGEGAGLLVEALVLEDPVDDAPALQLLGAEELAGHHELAGAAAAGALGEPLGAAHRRRQPDHFLDQAELGRAARRGSGRSRAPARRPRSGSARGRRRRPAAAALPPARPRRSARPRARSPAPASARRTRRRRRRRRRRGPRRGSAAPAADRPRPRRSPPARPSNIAAVEEVERRAVDGHDRQPRRRPARLESDPTPRPYRAGIRARGGPRRGSSPAPGRAARR